MIRPVHPFPARMAPDLAINELQKTKAGSLVLDPMAGSGTVIREACELGHSALGFDCDPLAVLMARVWTTPASDKTIDHTYNQMLGLLADERSREPYLPWIDNDEETSAFITRWFAKTQRDELRRLAHVILSLGQWKGHHHSRAIDILKIAFSRLIITKDIGASLARDVSHSRPHKVAEISNFDVLTNFDKSVRHIRKLLVKDPPRGGAKMRLGDARSLSLVTENSVDMILTSPPYLNAIDYMRGHRLSLVWLGYTVGELRNIRAYSIGSERRPTSQSATQEISSIRESMGDLSQLSGRHSLMVDRYTQDVRKMMSEIARVLHPRGRAILVVGNSCLKGTFVRNSEVVACAGSVAGLKVQNVVERDLPDGNRYLPMPSARDQPLGKRMRTESIITFSKDKSRNHGAQRITR